MIFKLCYFIGRISVAIKGCRSKYLKGSECAANFYPPETNMHADYSGESYCELMEDKNKRRYFFNCFTVDARLKATKFRCIDRVQFPIVSYSRCFVSIVNVSVFFFLTVYCFRNLFTFPIFTIN